VVGGRASGEARHVTKSTGDARRPLPLSEYTAEERDALLLADDLDERLERERQAAARLRSYLFGTAEDRPQP
jgi:hypothetical protein